YRPRCLGEEAVVRRRRSLVLVVAGVLLGLMSSPAPGWCHPLDPALLELWEAGDATVEVLWRLPLTQPIDAPLRPVLPNGCTGGSSAGGDESGSGPTQRWHVTCRGHSLVGERIGV